MSEELGLLLIANVIILGFGKTDEFRAFPLGDFSNAPKSSKRQLMETLFIHQSHGRQFGEQVIGLPERKAEGPTPCKFAGKGLPIHTWKASPIWIGGLAVVTAAAPCSKPSDTERQVEIRLSGPAHGSVQVVLVALRRVVEAVTSLLGAGNGLCRAKVRLVDVINVLIAQQEIKSKAWAPELGVQPPRSKRGET